MAPDRRPEDERDACGAGAEVGGGQRDAAGQPGDDGAEAARGGEPADAALARAHDWERRVRGGDLPAVADAAADEREDDVLGCVQGGEGADPERGGVVGDEEHRAPVPGGARVVLAHRSACS
jgi:hypothetical protein